MTAVRELFNEPAGLFWHGAAVAYSLAAWSLGLAGLFSNSIAVNLAATLLLAHGMVIAAYIVHECSHNTVFRRGRHNAMLGRAMTWICGACYGTYEDIRYKHFRHHVDNDDVVWFDYDAFFACHPLLTRIVKALEWLYIPAHEIVMHTVMVFTSFVIPARRHQRRRNVLVIALRGGAFLLLCVFAPLAALLYAVACMLMLHVLRFMDMLQHDYPYSTTLFEYVAPPQKSDAAWEQEHTFSNPLSVTRDWPNWLVLNFGFHNAHHAAMNTPWYRLPALHREMRVDDDPGVIPVGSQLALFHQNRVRRVHNEQGGDYPKGREYLRQARAGEGAIGGNAASFLTSF